MKIYKLSSLTLTVSVGDREEPISSISDIANVLNDNLFSRWMSKDDYAYYSEYHVVPQYDTITIDGFDSGKKSGIINFYVEGIRNERVNFFTSSIKMFLKSRNIDFGDFKNDVSNMYNVPVIRIPVSFNHSGVESTPSLNMSNNNAFFIFNKVLGMNIDLWDVDSLNPIDLKNRIEYFEGEHNLPEGDLKDPLIEEGLDILEDRDFLSGKSALSNYDENKVREQLSKIKSICEWAIKNGYKDLVIS